MDLDLPPPPPMFLMADASARNPLLTAAGFPHLIEHVLEIDMPISNADATMEFIDKGAVRTRLVYERQTPEVREKIREAVTEATDRYLNKGRSTIPSPALLVTATRS